LTALLSISPFQIRRNQTRARPIARGWTGAAVYDPASGVWLPTSRLRARQDDFPSATLLLNGKVLLAGGQTTDGEVLADAELYRSGR
jgi:hypothetical protein